MILKVNKDICEIKQNEVWNVGDYNVHTVLVELSDEFDGLVNKVRYFVEDNSYDMLITDNVAQVPYEATLTEGTIKIGVYGYDADTNILVQSTSPVNKYISSGTYTGEADNTEPLTPTDKQQMESAIQQNTDDIIDLQNNKQDVLISGENIKTINNESILGTGNIEIDVGSINYNDLENKPKINNVTLSGNKSLSELGIQPSGNYATMNDLTEESRAIFNEIETTYYNKNQTNNLLNTKQNTLISGQNIKTINNESLLGEGNIIIQGGGSGGTSNYTDLTNKPKINNVELKGNKSLNDLGIQPAGNYALESEIPDVSNFITKTVNDLTNYYKKSETFTKQEVNNLISAITTMNIQVVQALPTQDISTTTIYLVPKATSEVNDAYDEYIYVSNAWEHIGSTEVDLTNYVTKTDYATTTEAGVMSSTDKIKLNETSGYYGTCSTAAGTSAKVVVCDNFVLETGAIIYVKFTNAQTYNGTATLNVNSTGAKDIARVGTTKSTRYYWTAGELVGFVYDGTNYLMVEKGTATTSYYGLTKLTTSATSTSDTVALTPKSLNSFAQGVVADYPVYSTSGTYEVGDRVRYSYNIYECVTAITTAEAWNADHWIQKLSLQEQLDEKEDKYVSYPFSIANKKIDNNGVENTQNNGYCTEFIPCKPGVTVDYYGKSLWYQTQYYLSMITFYNSNKQPIETNISFGSEKISTDGNLIKIAPKGTAYVRGSTNGLEKNYYFRVFTDFDELIINQNKKYINDSDNKARHIVFNAEHLPGKTTKPLTLLHFSDIHGDNGALNDIVDQADKYFGSVDDMICTGDLVSNVGGAISSWWNPRVLTCIGNHE